VRRFEREHLTVLREGCLDLVQRRAGPCRKDQFGGFVFDDPAIGPDVDDIAIKSKAVKILGATTAYTQCALIVNRRGDGIPELFNVVGQADSPENINQRSRATTQCLDCSERIVAIREARRER